MKEDQGSSQGLGQDQCGSRDEPTVGAAAALAWTPWSGGSCPLAPDVMVEIRCRDGSTGIERADHWNWNSKFAPIVAYRISQAPAE